MERGYFSIGILFPKKGVNIGTLWRSAHSFGAASCFIIGPKRDCFSQSSDTTQAYRHCPFYVYDSFDSFSLPYSAMLIGVELDSRAIPLTKFSHPERAIYLLGSEDCGLPEKIRKKCHALIQIPGKFCLNVATAGSIVMYDRITKNIN